MNRGRRQTVGAPKSAQNSDQTSIYQNVEEIMAKKNHFDLVFYRVRWPNSWEPEANLTKLKALEIYRNGSIEDNSTDYDCDLHPMQGDEEKWIVQKILKHRISGKMMEYFVQWKDTWVWEGDLNRPDLIREFAKIEQRKQQQQDAQQQQWPNDLMKNHNESTKKKSRKRKRHNDTIEIDFAEQKLSTTITSTNTPKVGISTRLDLPPIITEDEEIKCILERAIIQNVKMFLFERLNGELALIPVRIANIKYPDPVMTFYESKMKWFE